MGLWGAMDLMTVLLIRFPPFLWIKSKRRRPMTFFSSYIFLLNVQDNTAIVFAAGLADTMGHLVRAAAGALYESGFLQLPVGRTSFISSLTRYFTFRDSHCDTS